jgi:hypothetical protein
MGLRSAITVTSSATFGKTASNRPVVCGAVAATCTRSVLKKEIHLPQQHAATASWRKEKKAFPPIIGAAVTRRRRCRKGSHREHPTLQRERYYSETSAPQMCPWRRRSEAAQSNSIGHKHAKWQWQVQPQWNRGSLCPYTNTNSMQGSPLGLQM